MTRQGAFPFYSRRKNTNYALTKFKIISPIYLRGTATFYEMGPNNFKEDDYPCFFAQVELRNRVSPGDFTLWIVTDGKMWLPAQANNYRLSDKQPKGNVYTQLTPNDQYNLLFELHRDDYLNMKKALVDFVSEGTEVFCYI